MIIDRRDEILNEIAKAEGYTDSVDMICINGDIDKVKIAMDENGKRLCLELLEYMAKNNIECGICKDGPFFLQKKDMKYKAYTAEQLFENFL